MTSPIDEPAQPRELLDGEGAEQYVERRMFGEEFESLERHTARMAALGDKTRYSILYLMYEYGELAHASLDTISVPGSDDVEQSLETLTEVNLIEKVPAPAAADGGHTYYRITTLGKQAIDSGLQGLSDERRAARFRSQQDPNLNPETVGADTSISDSTTEESDQDE